MLPMLIRALTNIYVDSGAPTPREMDEYTDAVLRIADRVDEQTLLSVARKLATYADAPPVVIDHLVSLGGAPAAHLLRNSDRVSPERLMEVAQSGSEPLACSVAERVQLDGGLTRALAARTERTILLTLSRNAGAAFDKTSFRLVATRARRDLQLAAAIGPRAPTAEDAAPLFLHVGSAVRAQIIRHARVAELLGSRRDVGGPGEPPVDAQELEQLAIAGDLKGFVGLLSQAIGVPHAEIEGLIGDPTLEAVAILFAAIGITAPTAGRIFLSGVLGKGGSIRHVHELVSIVASLSQRAARGLVSEMCGGLLDERRTPAHVPFLDSTAAPVPSRAGLQPASAVERRAPASRRRDGGRSAG